MADREGSDFLVQLPDLSPPFLLKFRNSTQCGLNRFLQLTYSGVNFFTLCLLELFRTDDLALPQRRQRYADVSTQDCNPLLPRLVLYLLKRFLLQIFYLLLNGMLAGRIALGLKGRGNRGAQVLNQQKHVLTEDTSLTGRQV